MSVVVELPVRPAAVPARRKLQVVPDQGLVVVVVDDQASARTMLSHVLVDVPGVAEVHDFGDANAALDWCSQREVDLILLDYRMPGMDGLELARSLKMLPHHRNTPIILVTVIGDEPVRQAALEAGVIDFLLKPVRPRELRARCQNLLQLRQDSHDARGRMRELEASLRASLYEIESRERETLVRLARAIEFRDAGTSAYLERMSRIAGLIAEEMGMSEEQVRIIEAAAPLHDLGKIAIPDSVLLKPGKLDADELSIMRRHPLIGHELLAGSQNRSIQMAAAIARGHHERFDGTGYPDGLKGDQIALEARIVAVADVFDALLSPRPYKEAWTIDAALEYLIEQSGKHFDPACIQALMRRRSDVDFICQQHSTACRRPGI